MSKIVKLEWGNAELTEKELSALTEIIEEMNKCKKLHKYVEKKLEDRNTGISVSCGKLSEECIEYFRKRGISAKNELFGTVYFEKLREESP